jgi:LAS superfamily LD-carboxypeptidase LdcB
MTNHTSQSHAALWTGFIAFLILGGGIAYVGYTSAKSSKETNARVERLTSNLYSLQLSIASTTQILQGTIAQTHSELADALAHQQQTVQSQINGYQQQVSSVAGTVSTLQKLSKTDPELLQKYSKVFFLNENYAPAELTEVPSQYRYSDAKHNLITTAVWPHMKAMLDAATAANIKLYVYSSYRSFNEQSALKGDYKVTYGAGTANSFSADQGYSEHQLGTTADFITSGLGGQVDGFEKTPAYTWMQANAYKYGFVLSYPANNTYYVFEPWHWRYVGVKLATDLHNANQNFADWDQRKIDEYLVNLFD